MAVKIQFGNLRDPSNSTTLVIGKATDGAHSGTTYSHDVVRLVTAGFAKKHFDVVKIRPATSEDKRQMENSTLFPFCIVQYYRRMLTGKMEKKKKGRGVGFLADFEENRIPSRVVAFGSPTCHPAFGACTRISVGGWTG